MYLKKRSWSKSMPAKNLCLQTKALTFIPKNLLLKQSLKTKLIFLKFLWLKKKQKYQIFLSYTLKKKWNFVNNTGFFNFFFHNLLFRNLNFHSVYVDYLTLFSLRLARWWCCYLIFNNFYKLKFAAVSPSLAVVRSKRKRIFNLYIFKRPGNNWKQLKNIFFNAVLSSKLTSKFFKPQLFQPFGFCYPEHKITLNFFERYYKNFYQIKLKYLNIFFFNITLKKNNTRFAIYQKYRKFYCTNSLGNVLKIRKRKETKRGLKILTAKVFKKFVAHYLTLLEKTKKVRLAYLSSLAYILIKCSKLRKTFIPFRAKFILKDLFKRVKNFKKKLLRHLNKLKKKNYYYIEKKKH